MIRTARVQFMAPPRWVTTSATAADDSSSERKLTMIFSGKTIQLEIDSSAIATLCFDRQDGPVNKLDRLTLAELEEAIELLQQQVDIKGLLLSSAKHTFIVGADVTELFGHFSLDDFAFKAWLRQTHRVFGAIENLPYPTVAAINGMALGGGFELALCCDYRILTDDARVGLPEVNLGIYPGWGGSVRLPRIVGLQAGLDWMLTGRPQKASDALAIKAVDQVVDGQMLVAEAKILIEQQLDGGYLVNRERKWKSIPSTEATQSILFEISNKVKKRFGHHYPAPSALVALVREHHVLDFSEAIECEVECFPGVAKGPVARSLIGLFLNDQLLKSKAKSAKTKARKVNRSAVLGAGIMGGGIAYQSALTGTPILMKDIDDQALELGLGEADKLLEKRVERGRLSKEQKTAVLTMIDVSLVYENLDDVGLVVEAVVENPAVKAAVLVEVEAEVGEDTVLASNTSSISITRLAQNLKRPDKFCGMHFFNPVHAMPLVEVIRGEQSSEETIATTVAYAASMGKTPIVVNDCPGFLVNRILFPYFNAFNRLLKDGVRFERIDKVMEDFGWPMGPAYLADVIGLDTLVHADGVMVEGFPERMGHDGKPVVNQMVDKGMLGQKNGQGFYRYGIDDNDRRFKKANSQALDTVQAMAEHTVEISDHEIAERMMIPLCLEAVHCLEEEIVGTAAEVDMGLILGLGFPRFRGGPLRYIDNLGLDVFSALVEKYRDLGALYQPTVGLASRLARKQNFFN